MSLYLLHKRECDLSLLVKLQDLDPGAPSNYSSNSNVSFLYEHLEISLNGISNSESSADAFRAVDSEQLTDLLSQSTNMRITQVYQHGPAVTAVPAVHERTL